MPVDIVMEDRGWVEALGTTPDALVRDIVEGALGDRLGPRAARVEVTVLLADDATVAELNLRWRRKAGPTNVLSFPTLDPDAARALCDGAPLDARPLPPDFLDESVFPLGDIALARETVVREAERQGKPPGNHLAHLLVHGTLHLLGYDHLTEDEARVMERIEIDILAARDIPDPYADGELPEDGAAPTRPER